jgi:aryl-alcohol dehydrogenase-like predicted oxidoreductase
VILSNANQALVDPLGYIAKQKKATPAKIALAWLLKIAGPSWFSLRSH